MYLKIVLYKNMDVSKLLFVVHEITTYFLCLGNIICLKTISVFFVFWLFLVVLSTCVHFSVSSSLWTLLVFLVPYSLLKTVCRIDRHWPTSNIRAVTPSLNHLKSSSKSASTIITHSWITHKKISNPTLKSSFFFLHCWVISATEVQLRSRYECCLVNFYRGINQERWNWCNHENEEDPAGS